MHAYMSMQLHYFRPSAKFKKKTSGSVTKRDEGKAQQGKWRQGGHAL